MVAHHTSRTALHIMRSDVGKSRILASIRFCCRATPHYPKQVAGINLTALIVEDVAKHKVSIGSNCNRATARLVVAYNMSFNQHDESRTFVFD